MVIGIAIGIVAGIALLKLYEYFTAEEETKTTDDKTADDVEPLIARRLR